MWPEGFSPNRSGCAEVLSGDTSAIAALVAASGILEGPDDSNSLFDDEGQPVPFEALEIMLGSKVPHLEDDNLHRILGLLHAATGLEYFEDPDHFLRMTGAIVYGDPYRYEEDEEDPLLVEIVWAMYQVDLLMEEGVDEILSDAVGGLIRRINEDNALDEELMRKHEPDFEGSIEDFYESLIEFRKIAARGDLEKCGFPESGLQELYA